MKESKYKIETKVIDIFQGKLNWNKIKIKDKLRISSKGKVELLSYHQISYLEACSNYTKVHLKDGSQQLVSKTLKVISAPLFKYGFFKIHKSFSIQVDEIRFFDKTTNEIELLSGIKLPVSRNKKKEVLDLILN